MVIIGSSDLIKWIFDTNLLSETKRPKPNREVSIWLSTLANEQIHTTTMNIAELEYGMHVSNDSMQKLEIAAWINRDLIPWLGDRIFTADQASLLRWRILSREREKLQEKAPTVDLLIAAIAHQNSAGVATRDTAPFVACGIPTLNPWTGERFNGA
jgi:predicted nucleic acid-binding protein